MFKLDAAVTFKPCKSLSMTEMCTLYLSNLKNSFANKNESRGRATASELGCSGGPISKTKSQG
jgi:hypothetical protein